MFGPGVEVYDLIYSGKDYAAESRRLVEIAASCGIGAGARLLDVACGTGRHIEQLAPHFRVEGLDIDERFVAAACRRNTGIPIHIGDMASFALPARYDLILCLFKSINYLPDRHLLAPAIANFRAHLSSGGAILVEAGPYPHEFRQGRGATKRFRDGAMSLVRTMTVRREGDQALYRFDYEYRDGEVGRSFSELHRCQLFAPAEFEQAFAEAGLAHCELPGRIHVGRAGPG
jgi:SAM-dependent methyltransferase